MESQTSPIELYKPTSDIQQVFSFDENLPDNKLTFVLHKNLTVARKIQDATFLAIGKMLKVMRDRKLYKLLDFDDFSQYLASEELSFSREKAYLYIRIYERFVDELELDPNEIAKLGVVRLMLLAPIVKDLDKEDAIKRIDEAKDLRYNDFVKSVKSTVNKTGKPNVFWSDEADKWIVQFFEDNTHLINLGKFKDHEKSEDNNAL